MSQCLTPKALIGLPVDTVWAPWSAEEVHQLNRRQADDQVQSYRCPYHDTKLFATVAGWICARKRCRFRQEWAHERHTAPFVPPPRRGQ